VFRTGKPELVQVVKEYEKLHHEELELEGFDTSSMYDASLTNGPSSKTHRSFMPPGGLGTPTEGEGEGVSELDVGGSVSAQSSGTTQGHEDEEEEMTFCQRRLK
jgi:hypothetical protein